MDLKEYIGIVRSKVDTLEHLKSPLSEKDVEAFRMLRESLDQRETTITTRTLTELEVESMQRELSIVSYFLGNDIFHFTPKTMGR